MKYCNYNDKNNTESKRLSIWHFCRHWWHHKLSLWQLKPLSHQGGVLTATARRARKTQNAEVRAVRSPRAPRDRRGISTGRRGVPTAIRMSAVWTQWVRSGNAVTAQWGLLGRHEDAVRTQRGRIWSPQRTPPYTTIIRECNEGIKNDKFQNFNFQNLISAILFGSISQSSEYHIFSVAACLRCLLHHILPLIAYTFRENGDFVFITIVEFMMSWTIRIRFGLQILFVCLYLTPSHYHHCANLSEDIELIKCLSDIFCRVCEWD